MESTYDNTVSIWKDCANTANTVDGKNPAPPNAIMKPHAKLDVLQLVILTGPGFPPSTAKRPR